MISLIGLGAGDASTLSRGAELALREASALHATGRGHFYVRTLRHPSASVLKDWDLAYQSFDELYESAHDFASVYMGIAQEVIRAATAEDSSGATSPVAFAVPGHPLFAEESVRLIINQATELSIAVEIIASGSFVESVLTAVRAPLGDGCDLRDALTMSLTDQVDRFGNAVSAPIDTSRGLLLYQIYDTFAASNAKLALMRSYPDDWSVALVQSAGVAGAESVKWMELYQLDRVPVDHLTSLYVPALPPESRPARFTELVGIMARLRSPNGCPWDLEQDHKSLKRYFIEETYEVLEAIDAEDSDLLAEELGDALLQVVFHAQLGSEEGLFNIDDVTDRIVRKLVRRHPHIFGDVAVEDSDEVLRNWEQIKRQEKSGNEQEWRPSILDGIPKGLPALMQALEVSKRAVRVGFEWESIEDVLAKLDEEISELKAEISAPSQNPTAIASEVGDLLFTVVQIARWNKLDAEDSLRTMVTRFSCRFRYMEKTALARGENLVQLSARQLDELWIEAKRAEDH